MEDHPLRTLWIGLMVVASAVIAFFATCQTVTEGALLVVNRNVRPGEAQVANQIFYGLFVGIPLGLVAAGFAGWMMARWFAKKKDRP